MLIPSELEAFQEGQKRPLSGEEDGSLVLAMAVHAEIKVALMSRSAVVRLHVPFGSGRLSRLPKTKGISAVWVALKSSRAS
jgi:predicted NUDIX family NTP pyrophosphohydrolase